MLRKAQKTRKEQLERKLSSRNVNDINTKENINMNKEFEIAVTSKLNAVTKQEVPTQVIKPAIVEQVKPFSKEEFRATETQKLMNTYSADLIEELLKKENQYWVRNCLGNHNIPSNIRAKMIDWMVEVLCSYKCSNNTFFVAVYYLDAFFKATEMKYDIND